MFFFFFSYPISTLPLVLSPVSVRVLLGLVSEVCVYVIFNFIMRRAHLLHRGSGRSAHEAFGELLLCR